jgi:hypothetical protein
MTLSHLVEPSSQSDSLFWSANWAVLADKSTRRILSGLRHPYLSEFIVWTLVTELMPIHHRELVRQRTR